MNGPRPALHDAAFDAIGMPEVVQRLIGADVPPEQGWAEREGRFRGEKWGWLKILTGFSYCMRSGRAIPREPSREQLTTIRQLDGTQKGFKWVT